MDFHRPDLNNVNSEVVQYIEALEAELERLRKGGARARPRAKEAEEEEDFSVSELVTEEPPTTIQVITATASGIGKRTARHLYQRQRRGGMGVFDLDAPGDEPPVILVLADESQSVLLVTRQGRAFRMPVNQIPEAPLRGRGESIISKMKLGPEETLGAILPIWAQGYIVLASQTGMVRLLRHHVFGEYMKPGAALFDARSFGPLAAACWTSGEDDLFIATQQGKAVRFPEKLVPPQGGVGIRLSEGDQVVAITGVDDQSNVFLLGADGRGAIRRMEGFNANKAPGAGGKIAITTDRLVGAMTIEEASDIFVISRLSKIIRFQAAEVPAKEGVVQGVNCMSFRADEAVALTASFPSRES
jgi:DNA gyrase subunit A